MAPRDEAELCRMMVTALESERPSAIRYPRGAGRGAAIPELPETLEIGKAEVVTEGDDVLVIAIGSCVETSLAAAGTLREEGLSATVVNARFAKPLDEELICDLAARIPRVVTVEENALAGGFGSSVLELLSDRGVAAAVRRVGVPDRFIPHGSTDVLMRECGLDAESLSETFKAAATDGLSDAADTRARDAAGHDSQGGR
jgi:1-deoxy-D-xylulose-5-phosphate synthase